MKSLTTLALLTATIGTLQAGPTPVPVETQPSTGDWHFRIIPYIWATATSGDVMFLNHSQEVSQSFADTYDDHNMSAHFLLEAGKGRWLVQSDFIYGHFNNDTQLAGPGPIKSVRQDLKEWIIMPRIGYSLVDDPNQRIDLLVGARYSRFRLGVTGRFSAGGQTRSETLQEIWDPTITVAGHRILRDKWFTRYMGEIGGFGVSSDFIWQAGLGVGYQFNPTASVVAGYRVRAIDYSADDFLVDTVTHGPTLELEFKF